MANMELIQTKTVGAGGAANIEFTGLGAYNSVYTDLYLLCSIRSNQPYTADNAFIQLNGSSSGFNWKNVYSTGSGTPLPQIGTDSQVAGLPGTGTVTNAFGNQSFYIADFAGSSYKLINGEGSVGNASTRGDNWIWSTLWSNVAAITSIKILPSAGLLIENSSVSLYGIQKTPSSPKATGGIVSQDASYWYHMFPFTSTFAPTQALTTDCLVIAGGGGSGRTGGGGGAGGLRSLTSQSMTATTYTVTVGAGGAGSTADGGIASNGSNSSIAGSGFSTITASGGGGGASYSAGNAIGASGGSGGGGGTHDGNSTNRSGGAGNQGGYTPVEGYAGGSAVPNRGSGGGGGAGGVGSNAPATNVGGAGGIGATSTFITQVALATQTGQNVNGTFYYAGGGAGSTYSGVFIDGGAGGGGNGGAYQTGPKNGLVNTGGGAGSNNDENGYLGGSGLVVIRYAK